MSKDIGGIEPLPDIVPGMRTTYAPKRVGGYWKLEDGRHLHLLTPMQLHAVPAGTVLTDIFGRDVTVTAVDPPDPDTRFGYTAWGAVCPLPCEGE